MSEKLLYSLILLCGVFLSAVSQIILKKSAMKTYGSRLAEYLNPRVIIAYTIFLGCSFLSMYSLKVIDLSLSTVLESTGYICVTILGAVFLKEKIRPKKLIGMAVIVIGIAVFTMSF